jgi:hypothetical protein
MSYPTIIPLKARIVSSIVEIFWTEKSDTLKSKAERIHSSVLSEYWAASYAAIRNYILGGVTT